MTGSASSADTAAAGFTHRQILVIMSGLMAGMLLAALDQTIVATAIRTIADDLDGYALQAWVTTAYLITASAAQHVLTDSSIVQQLSPALARPFQDGFADSMSTVFVVVTEVAAVALILVLFWKEVPLRTQGGLQARAAEARNS